MNVLIIGPLVTFYRSEIVKKKLANSVELEERLLFNVLLML